MKKIILIFAFCFMFSLNTLSQNIIPTFQFYKTETYTLKNNFTVFKGKISTSEVTMFFDNIPISDGDINGKYYYDKNKKYILLNGEIKKGNIILKEILNGKVTGFFSGTINKNNVFNGVWKSADGKKEFNFSVEKSKSENSNVSLKVNFYKSGYDESFNYYDKDKNNYIKKSEINYSSILALIDNTNKNAAIEKINIDLNWLKTKTATVKDLENYEINNIKNFYSEWADEGKKEYTCNTSISVNVGYFDGKIINFAESYEGYYGGAHGSYTYTSKIYFIETGENISSVKKLVKNSNDKNLINLLRKKLVSKETEMTEDNYFDFNNIRLNDNFFVSEKGITFYYTQYEIAAYAYGGIEVFFAFDELKPFVKQDSPLIYLFN